MTDIPEKIAKNQFLFLAALVLISIAFFIINNVDTNYINLALITFIYFYALFFVNLLFTKAIYRNNERWLEYFIFILLSISWLLIIFGFIFNKNKTLSYNMTTITDWITVIGTLILGFFAIFGEQIRKSLFKPQLKPIEMVKTTQRIGSDNFVYQRLIVKNVGNNAAEMVRILLTYIKVPKNFIPIPLAWTHYNTAARDISKSEPAYIDVLRKQEGSEKYAFCWTPEVGIPYEKLLAEFNPDQGNIRLEIFERDRKIGDITLKYKKEADELSIG